jgi:hypothetical protein
MVRTSRTISRNRSAFFFVVILAILGVVLYVVRDNTAPNDLKVGDCFDIPTAATIKTVVHHPCTEPHTAEVFDVVQYASSNANPPISFVIDGFVGDTCGPAFTTYVGKAVAAVPDLTVGYFYPSSDSWSSGDRTITCYVSKADESSLSKSLKGSAGP